ncbi:MAG: DNA-directed RNA polymerase subunit delta [Gemella sp.]|nr:DNA-directed RNA polymerase subunit delta [Gemella sp.]
MAEIKLNNSSITEQCYQYMIDNEIKNLNIYDFMDHIRPQFDVSDEEFAGIMSYFYTDLNVDGRFVCVEDGTWTLKDDLTMEDVKAFVEPSISTTSLDEFEDVELLEDEEFEEDVTDELDEHRAAEDEDDETEDFDGGFSGTEDIKSELRIDATEEEF